MHPRNTRQFELYGQIVGQFEKLLARWSSQLVLVIDNRITNGLEDEFKNGVAHRTPSMLHTRHLHNLDQSL